MKPNIFFFIFAFTIVSSTCAQAKPEELKVLSYNLSFGELASLEQLAKFIKSEDPDIVALQEVDVGTS